jgi:hypothetical protein
MPDNVPIKDGNGLLQALRTKETALGVHLNLQALADPVTGAALTLAAGGRVPVESRNSLPVATSATIMSVTTAAVGANWTAFAAQACTSLDLVNNSGTTIEYRRGAAGVGMPIPTGSARMIIGITNANQIQVRRTDLSATQVTVQAEALSS